jgi:hypothetical protein
VVEIPQIYGKYGFPERYRFLENSILNSRIPVKKIFYIPSIRSLAKFPSWEGWQAQSVLHFPFSKGNVIQTAPDGVVALRRNHPALRAPLLGGE